MEKTVRFLVVALALLLVVPSVGMATTGSAWAFSFGGHDLSAPSGRGQEQGLQESVWAEKNICCSSSDVKCRMVLIC